jgi:TM2 domain-containing membrane protein YozV
VNFGDEVMKNVMQRRSRSISRADVAVVLQHQHARFLAPLGMTLLRHHHLPHHPITSSPKITQNHMNPTYGVPALLSFFIPGLGQLIKGQILKAFLIWAVGGALSFFLVWTIVVPFVIWAWNVYDAYNDPA